MTMHAGNYDAVVVKLLESKLARIVSNPVNHADEA